MVKRKRRRLKKKPVAILLIIIISIIYLVYHLVKSDNKNSNENNNELYIKYSNLITENSEKNPELVKRYFVDGMSTDDYLLTIDQKTTYLDEKGNYSKISYDFEKHYHYYEFEEIFKSLDKSDIVKIEIIGTSVDNRNLYSIEIGNGEEVTMFEAGIHAAEVASPLFITKFMVDLVNNYESGDEEIINLLKNNKIVILPFANPDGYEASIFGTTSLNNQNLYLAEYANKESLEYLKCNANGVDINRNFPSQTAGLYYTNYSLHNSVSLNKSIAFNAYYPGEILASEPETKAIMYWQNKWIKNLKSYVALHSAGRIIYNGKPYLSDEFNNNSNNCAGIIENITGYTAMSKDDEEAGIGNDGTSSEYMAEALSGFTFSTKTGRLSSEFYAKKEDGMKYKDTCVIVIESLEKYTSNLTDIKNEYYDYNLNEAYFEIIDR